MIARLQLKESEARDNSLRVIKRPVDGVVATRLHGPAVSRGEDPDLRFDMLEMLSNGLIFLQKYATSESIEKWL
ncbi:MAG: hypothetical protein RQ722_00835 [Desulfuromonadales bacterium]|nr:hypothetical protein [Desulfuromonadales bacterium]